MNNIKPCIIELSVNSTRMGVYEGNKIKANEYKGNTSRGVPFNYFALFCESVCIGYYTPFEFLHDFGTYQLIYN